MSAAAFEGDVGAMVASALRGVARHAGKNAGLEAAEAFQVRGLGILENIKELVGGLSVE